MRYLTLGLLSLAIRPVFAQVPTQLLGRWRIARILPTSRPACWDASRSQTLLGSTLLYQPHSMTWQGGLVPLIGIEAITRTLTPKQLTAEYAIPPSSLGIPASGIQEVDLQHEDADVTGSTTEVPGDTILFVNPGRIILSACGIFYEAIRARP